MEERNYSYLIQPCSPLEKAASGSLAAVFASVVQCPLEHVKCQMQAKRLRGQKDAKSIGLNFPRHLSSVRIAYRGLGEANVRDKFTYDVWERVPK